MGRIIKFFRSYLFCGIYLLFIYPKINKLIKHKDKYSFEYRYAYAKKKINTLMSLLKVKIEVTGLENIESEDKVLLVPNHNSYTDALLLSLVVDKPIIFVAKKETLKQPFIGKLCNLIDALFLDRENLRQSLVVINQAKAYLEQNRCVAIFPEGTRNKSNSYDLLNFKPGTFKTAIDTNSAIAPIVIKGSKDILSSRVKKSYLVKIEVLRAIQKEEYADLTSVELSQQVFHLMQNKINEI